MSRPHFGHTKSGLPVHRHTIDYHRDGRFNKAVALALTKRVGSMPMFWIFNILALLSLPATFHLMGVIPLVYHAHGALVAWNFCLSYGWIFLVTWVCQNYIQLVCLPAIIVGQNLEAAASDARAAKTFEDVESLKVDVALALNLLDVHTEGGIRIILDAITALGGQHGENQDSPAGGRGAEETPLADA